jgi:signal transduction histidine kinase
MVDKPKIRKVDLYQAVFTSIHDAILLVNKQLVVLFTNGKLSEVLGVRVNPGVSLSQIAYLPSDLDKLFNFTNELTSVASQKKITVSLKGEGEHRQFSVSGSIVSSTDFIVLVFRDIHDQEVSETLRLHADRVEAIQHINSQISHELRSPLTTIHLDLEFMKEQLGIITEFKKITEELTRDCAKAVLVTVNESLEQLEYILNILSNLSDYSRLSAVSEEVINVKEVIEITAKILRVATQMKDLPPDQFILDLGGLEDAMVRMNKMWLSQVVWNLCMNAYEAIPPDGRIKVVGKVKDKDVILRVINNGHIPEDSIDKIFTPHFTSKKKGGLGLPIVRSILFRSNGYVWAANHGDKVILTVRLPLCERQSDSGEFTCLPSGSIRVATNMELANNDDTTDLRLSAATVHLDLPEILDIDNSV